MSRRTRIGSVPACGDRVASAYTNGPAVKTDHCRYQCRVPGVPLNGPTTRDVIQPP